MKTSKDVQTYNDGVINVLDACDGVINKTIYENIHFGNKTLGINRFYSAKTAGDAIERVIAIPFCDLVNRKNIIELTDFRTGKTDIYSISMYQEKYDFFPESIILTLKKTEIEYVDNR